MKLEREESITVLPSNTGAVEVKTKVTNIRRSLHFVQDAEREKDNQMYQELGKAGLTLSAIVAAGLSGISQVTEGFNSSDPAEMGKGLVLVLLASTLIPHSRNFYNEALLLRREKNAIKKSRN